MAELDDFVMAAASAPEKAQLAALTNQLKDTAFTAETAETLSVLWEAWEKAELNPDMVNFIRFAAERFTTDPGAFFRKEFSDAARMILPRELAHNPIMRSLGIRNEHMPVAEIATRLNRLLVLQVGSVVFLPATGRWGAVTAIDAVNGSVGLGPFRGNGSSLSTPLDIVLGEAIVFSADEDLKNLMEASASPVSSVRFREIVKRRAKMAVSDKEMRSMALAGCAKKMTESVFNNWWASTAATAATARRRGCDGRNLQEMALLLEAEGDAKFTADEYAAFAAFFTRLKPDTARREVKMLASIVAMMVERADAADFPGAMAPLAGKTIFWPADPVNVHLEDLAIWGELPAKTLGALGKATVAAFGNEYLTALLTHLPLKALNGFGALIDAAKLAEVIEKQHCCSADILCWIWKNRKKVPADLVRMVNIENVVRFLGIGDVPKAWGPAMRELRALLMDNADFQKGLIAQADGNAKMFTATLCGALFLSAAERQSLLVKLSRVSTLLQDALEGGAAKQILTAGVGRDRQNEVKAPPSNEPAFTSTKSHHRLIAELEDLINVQIPENREALKTARAHGDFRENSEFDAAKERRNQLSRRRTELERDLAQIQPMVMSGIAVSDQAVIGCELDLVYSDGEKENCYLVGAWDGDPDRRMLSYRTRLGKALLNRQVGESIDLGGRKVVIAAVRALPEKLAAELDD
ncbi:MAG: GreA/GreB family elongation factor [Victivallaceae bacterium]|nr:GreA/GreB family elongation factor [Victivallaceae bacterium]